MRGIFDTNVIIEFPALPLLEVTFIDSSLFAQSTLVKSCSLFLHTLWLNMDVQKISKSGLLIRLYWPFLDVKKHTTQKERRADFIKNRLTVLLAHGHGLY